MYCSCGSGCVDSVEKVGLAVYIYTMLVGLCGAGRGLEQIGYEARARWCRDGLRPKAFRVSHLVYTRSMRISLSGLAFVIGVNTNSVLS